MQNKTFTPRCIGLYWVHQQAAGTRGKAPQPQVTIMANATPAQAATTATLGGKGLHHNYYMACPRTLFAPNATLAFGGGPNGQPHCPWHNGVNGYHFYQNVLSHQPATVQAAIALGGSYGLKPRQVIDQAYNPAVYGQPAWPGNAPAPTPVPPAPAAATGSLILPGNATPAPTPLLGPN